MHHYFGTKDDLFLAALELPGRPARGDRARSLAGGVDGAAERLLAVFLSVWDDPDDRGSRCSRWCAGMFEPDRASG